MEYGIGLFELRYGMHTGSTSEWVTRRVDRQRIVFLDRLEFGVPDLVVVDKHFEASGGECDVDEAGHGQVLEDGNQHVRWQRPPRVYFSGLQRRWSGAPRGRSRQGLI